MTKPMKFAVFVLAVAIFAIAALLALPYIKKSFYSREYLEYITEYSQEYNVPEPLVCAVIHSESRFDKDAESKAGAKGLMQLMPDTFAWIANRLGDALDEEKITDPETNIKYGTYYLSYLYDRFNNWSTAVAAYNAGPNKVSAWLSDEKYSNDNVRLNNIPISETEDYVNRVFSAEKQYKQLYYKGED